MLANEVYEEGKTKDDLVVQVIDVYPVEPVNGVEISIVEYWTDHDGYVEAENPSIILDKAGVKRLIGILEESLTRMEEAE